MKEPDTLHDTDAFKELLTLYAFGVLEDGECPEVLYHVRMEALFLPVSLFERKRDNWVERRR